MREKITLDLAIHFLSKEEENYRETAGQKRQLGESQPCPQAFEIQAQHQDSNAEICHWIIERLEELRALKQQQHAQGERHE